MLPVSCLPNSTLCIKALILTTSNELTKKKVSKVSGIACAGHCNSLANSGGGRRNEIGLQSLMQPLVALSFQYFKISHSQPLTHLCTKLSCFLPLCFQ